MGQKNSDNTQNRPGPSDKTQKCWSKSLDPAKKNQATPIPWTTSGGFKHGGQVRDKCWMSWENMGNLIYSKTWLFRKFHWILMDIVVCKCSLPSLKDPKPSIPRAANNGPVRLSSKGPNSRVTSMITSKSPLEPSTSYLRPRENFAWRKWEKPPKMIPKQKPPSRGF